MALSYVERLICVAAVAGGLLMVAFELVLWVCAPLILHLSSLLSARHRERVLYIIQFVPGLLALLVTGAVCVPQYVGNETNLGSETVGWLCLTLAGAVLFWFGLTVFGGLRITFRTVQFTAACKRAGRGNGFDRNRLPIVVLPGVAHRVALTGFFRPLVLISQDLIQRDGLSPAALDVALDHERSHAEHLDNWKLLSFCFLPRLSLRVAGGRTWTQLWQSAAEWAADDDAVRNDSARVFLLAETLIALARPDATTGPGVLCTGLTCTEANLAERIDRLIYRSSASHSPHHGSWLLAVFAIALGVALTLARLTPLLHNFSERLLHLG